MEVERWLFESGQRDARPAQARRFASAAELQVTTIEQRFAVLRQACADKLLELHNERWNEGGPLTTPAAFKRALTLNSIHVHEGRTTVYLGAGDLYRDHGIEIRLSPRGRVREIMVS